jgi:hypothetical protein
MALAAKTDYRRMVMGGDCYNYAMLASGHLDIICEAGLKLHDWAALVPVVEGAGGLMTGTAIRCTPGRPGTCWRWAIRRVRMMWSRRWPVTTITTTTIDPGRLLRSGRLLFLWHADRGQR